MSGKGYTGQRSGRVDMCTPERVLQVAYTCIGRPDLDPASNPNSIVKADVHLADPAVWSDEDLPPGFLALDGLALDWHGEGVRSAWVNPPYSRWDNPRWAGKLQEQGHAGVAIVALVPAAPSCQWWEPYWNAEHLAFLPRIKHHLQENGSDFEQCLVAWNVDWFDWRDALEKHMPRARIVR